MANVEINQLPVATTPLSGTESIPADQGIQTIQLTVDEIKDYINETPVLPYKVYTALLTQSGTSAPTAVILQNTIGNIVWSYIAAGEYNGTLVAAFTPNKTGGFLGSDFLNYQNGGRLSNNNGDADVVNIQTWDVSNSYAPTNNVLLSTFVEIRVYP